MHELKKSNFSEKYPFLILRFYFVEKLEDKVKFSSLTLKKCKKFTRAMGLEPTMQAWQASVLTIETTPPFIFLL